MCVCVRTCNSNVRRAGASLMMAFFCLGINNGAVLFDGGTSCVRTMKCDFEAWGQKPADVTSSEKIKPPAQDGHLE